MTQNAEPKYLLEIVSDTICPWCYIGKARFQEAMEDVGEDVALEVRWRPFELNPDMPREGMDRKAYRSRKFGWEKSLQLDAQVKAAGAEAGLAFHHERVEKTPNTLSSHALARHAAGAGRQSALIDAIFQAYFTDGRDVGDAIVLADIAQEIGLDRGAAEAALKDEKLRAAVKAEALAFAQSGISGVPSFLLNRHLLFSGAQPPRAIAQTLRTAAADERVIRAGEGLLHG